MSSFFFTDLGKHSILYKFLSIVILFSLQGAGAQTVARVAATEATAKRPTALIKAGRILDVESGTYTGPTNILIRSGRIIAIGPDIQIPAGTQEYDLRAYTLMPGLIDADTHLLFFDNSFGYDFRKELALNARRSTTSRGYDAEFRAGDVLLAGFTTIRDLGNSGNYGDVDLRNAITRGLFPGPRMIVSGPALSPINGHFEAGTDGQFVSGEYSVIYGPDSAREAVRKHLAMSVSLIKVEADNYPNNQALSAAELNAIVEEAHASGMKVAAQAYHDQNIRNAVMAGVDTIEGAGQISEETMELIAEKVASNHKVTLVPFDFDREVLTTILNWVRPGHPANANKVDETIAASAARFKRAMALGVPMAMGSNMTIDLREFGLSVGEAKRHTLYAYVEEGASNLFAIRMATINAAEAVGLKDKIGVIKVGAYADMLAVDGDPLADIHALQKIRRVIKDGVPVSHPSDRNSSL